MDLTQTFICITGLAGHLLIARQDRRGYWFWIAGNMAIIKLSLGDGHYGMVGLFVLYTLISLNALRSWKKKEKDDADHGTPSGTAFFSKLKSWLEIFRQIRAEAEFFANLYN